MICFSSIIPEPIIVVVDFSIPKLGTTTWTGCTMRWHRWRSFQLSVRTCAFLDFFVISHSNRRTKLLYIIVSPITTMIGYAIVPPQDLLASLVASIPILRHRHRFVVCPCYDATSLCQSTKVDRHRRRRSHSGCIKYRLFPAGFWGNERTKPT